MVIVGVDKVKFVDYTRSNDFYLFEIGTYQCTPHYNYGPIVRTETIFHYVRSGKGFLMLDDKRYDIGENQGFVIPINCKAYYEADGDDPWHYAWIHIDGPRAVELFKQAGITHDNPVFTAKEDAHMLYDIIDDIYYNSDNELYCCARVYDFFNCLIKTSSNTTQTVVNQKLTYIKSAINYIQLRYSEPIGVEEIATACGLNRSYLTRLFKDATGYTPQLYLMTFRMKKASELLLESSETISNIAFMVGYSDTFTFSKAFKRCKGVSPKEYRLEH